MAGTTVNLFRSTDAGAPVLSANQGSLIDVLDACLVNGYNSKTITITRSGQTATATSTSHGFALDGGTKVRISGAAQSEYNGDFVIFSVTTNTFSFTVTGTPATPATGTITAAVAPLDWGKPFSGTGLAAYRSNVVTGTRLYLRINDNNPDANAYQTAKMVGYETMSDINTGVAPFPTVAQYATGMWVAKSNRAAGLANPWVLIGDGSSFYLACNPSPQNTGTFRLYHFGDLASFMQSDPYGCFITGDASNSVNLSADATSYLVQIIASTTLVSTPSGYLARAYTQLGGSATAGLHGNFTLGGTLSGYSGVVPFPNPCNNGLYLSPHYVSESASLRGKLPGMWQMLQVRPFNASNVIIPADQNPVSRRLVTLSTAGSGFSTYGERAFDIDGPWR